MLPYVKANYLARAIAVSFGKSSNQNKQIGVTVAVVENEALEGSEITWIGFFTEKTTARTIESLQHFGWTGDDLSELADLDADGCARLLPSVVEIVCDLETYEGEQQLRVKWINAPGGGKFSFKEKLEGSDLKSFAAQMRSSIRNARGGGGSRTAPTGSSTATKPKQPHPNAPGNLDDVPFATSDMAAEPSPIAPVLRW